MNLLCDDLKPVLNVLQNQYGAQVAHEQSDPREGSIEFYLAEEIPAEAMSSLPQEFSGNPDLKFGDGWIACGTHRCALNSASLMPPLKPIPPARLFRPKGAGISDWVYAAVDLVFVLLGVWMFAEVLSDSNWRNLLIGLGGTLFFGLAFLVQVGTIVQGFRRKRNRQ